MALTLAEFFWKKVKSNYFRNKSGGVVNYEEHYKKNGNFKGNGMVSGAGQCQNINCIYK